MIFRSKHRQNFLLVDNAAIRDGRLSLKATGLLALLLTYPDETRFSREGIRRMKPDGVRGIRAALVELGLAGYLVHEYHQDSKGRWSTTTFVYETPRGTGHQFATPLPISGARSARNDESQNGARRANTEERNPSENGARRVGTVIQNWRVTDGAKRATKNPSTEKEEREASSAPRGLASLNGQPPDLALVEPPIDDPAEHRRHARDILDALGGGVTSVPDEIQDELVPAPPEFRVDTVSFGP